MCGVLGFVDKRHRLSDAEHDRLWRCMLETMAHRGGEGDGVYRSARITLAHTRLRILDINPASDQRIERGDELILIGLDKALERLFDVQ